MRSPIVAIQTHADHYRLVAEQWFPQPIQHVFPFFSDASNLELVTPAWLGFHILTPLPVQMRQGLRLDYKISIHGVPLTWQTEIEVWEPQRRFVDVQRRGPYKLWRHEHSFVERDGGTAMTDTVDYDVPFGAVTQFLVVKRDLLEIFGFRQRVLRSLFDGPSEHSGRHGLKTSPESSSVS